MTYEEKFEAWYDSFESSGNKKEDMKAAWDAGYEVGEAVGFDLGGVVEEEEE